MEIIGDIRVKKIIIDERNESAIESLLRTIPNAHIIGFQNRFCIRVAKKIGLPCAFVDVLAWFWRDLPEDHLIADEVFWIRFPGLEDKRKNVARDIHLVHGIIRSDRLMRKNRRQLMVHIGGAKYPFPPEVPKNYLKLLAECLNRLECGDRYDQIYFTTGIEAVSYIRSLITNKNIVISTSSGAEFTDELSQTKHMLTTAGVSSTLEAFSFGIPTSFLLPINLSQIALTDLLSRFDACPNSMKFDDYVVIDDQLRQMSERGAMAELDKYAGIINKNNQLVESVVDDFVRMASSVPDSSNQLRIIEYVGQTGALEMVEILRDKWGE
jgi:hypothetical protein